MQVLDPCCCAIDVHAKTAVVCLIKQGKRQTRTFSTMTDELLRLTDWLTNEGCTHVAIERTGVYWKPVFNILEAALTVILVNARDAKSVPGRKTDVRDCEWLGDLLRHGLLRASFIPPLEIPELRELTRYRQTLMKEQTAVANRIQKLIESAKGVITTDRYGAYNWLRARRGQLCWAYLMRDFQAMVERGGDSAQVSQELLNQSKEMFRLWYEVRDGTLSRREFVVASQPIQRQVKKLLEAGSRSGHRKTGRTCQRIMKVEKSLWTFVRVEGVEPTNNAAERALRRVVLWQRKSFGIQSARGSEFVERILTAVTTLRQQGRDVLAYLTAVCCSVFSDEVNKGLIPVSS